MAKSEFICPFCFEEHKLSEIEFRCSNRRCKDFDDLPLTRYENGNLNLPKQGKKTFRVSENSPFNIAEYGICPECEQKTYKIVCPSCHNPLPESTLKGKDMIISVVGARDTGKSHFIGVIIKELMERISVKFGGAMEGFDDTMQRYKNGFEQRLYVDLQKLDLTKSSVQDINNGAYKPLIFTLKLKRKILFKEYIESFTLVFFDTAGEDLNDEDTMSTVNKYICKSAGIIFLLDPMQIPEVRNQLSDEVVLRASSVGWSQATPAQDIMTRVSNLIRNEKGLKSTRKISTPVAAVFSKLDVILPILPDGLTLLEPSPHCMMGQFDLSDCHNVNAEVESLLKNWGEDAFISQLGMNYSNFSFFTISSLGFENNPKPDWKIERPRPHRIEDPLLWLLKENGVIKGK